MSRIFRRKIALCTSLTYDILSGDLFINPGRFQTLIILTRVHVCAGLIELAPEELHAHDGTEDNEEENENSHVHQRYQGHQDGVHHDLEC